MSTSSNHSDEKLILLLRQRDKAGMEHLYDHYSEALFGVIFRIVRKNDVAEDLLQKTFVKIWKKIDFYDDKKGRLFTWMLNIARNNAIDYTRSKEFKKNTKVQSIDYTVYNNTSQRETQKTDTIGLDKIVDDLEPKYKELIDLVYFKGYTQQEISDELDIPLGTVKTRIRKGLQKLRAIFN
ncbi:MAG: sigma-70 family RNA polymerase sigma factor [Vicingaceae bacterium]